VASGDMRSIIAGGFHYIRDGAGREALYALDDVWEKDDLAPRDGMDDRLVQLRGELDAATAR
jgi:hypothetical protein